MPSADLTLLGSGDDVLVLLFPEVLSQDEMQAAIVHIRRRWSGWTAGPEAWPVKLMRAVTRVKLPPDVDGPGLTEVCRQALPWLFAERPDQHLTGVVLHGTGVNHIGRPLACVLESKAEFLRFMAGVVKMEGLNSYTLGGAPQA